MKYHVSLKFLAVLLCALMLLTSITSIIGIALLEKAELYEKDYSLYYQEYFDTIDRSVALELARQQLSRQLGGCDDALINALETTSLADQYFRQGSLFYTIRDLGGEVLYTNHNGVTETEDMEIRLTTGYYYRQLALTPSDIQNQHDESSVTQPTDPAVETIHIFAEKLGIYMTYSYQREVMPTVTVTLHLLPDARRDVELYDLALLLWQNRYNLFVVLAVSLLLFAVGAVYLCWSAGRKPDSDEIRAGGLNAIPLDLYTLGCVFFLVLAYEVAQEIGYWFDASQIVFTVFFLFLGFFCCLLFVAWCFAWAAQLKEGSGRWWRKSVLGWSLLTALHLAKAVLTRWIPDLIRSLWKGICRAFRWVGRKIYRIFSLLPLTWQWILLGGAMVLILFLTILGAIQRNEPLGILVGLGFCLSLILYGAYAFGLLLEGTQKMRQGNLDSKISDRLLLGSFRDFAGELNGLADVAKIAAEKEMRSERMKTELITNVSHDIKTPLTSIINYVDLLQKPHTPEEEREYLEVLGRKSQQLKKLIQDLMEMSKASTGNITADLQPLDAGEAIKQALGEFSEKLEASRLTPVVNISGEPLMMRGDGRLVWRVLSNLLSNAVKYALPGTRLYVNAARKGNQVYISLKNISAEPLNMDAEELMERFVRGDTARNTDGSGLGLNIARSLMEVQQGRLVLRVDGDLFTAALVLPAV